MAKNYLASMSQRAPTIIDYGSEEAERFDDSEQLRDLNTPGNLLMSKQIAQTGN
jgi:RNA polymerase sigma-70 factor (ECF subfamily)